MKRISCAAALQALILSLLVGCASQLDLDEQVSAKPWKHFGGASAGALAVDSLAFSPDGKQLVSTHYPQYPGHVRVSPLLADPPGQARLWERSDVGNGYDRWYENASLTIDKMLGHAPLFFSPDGKHVHVMNDSQVVRWNVDELKPERFDFKNSRAVSPDGRYVAVKDGDDHVSVFELNSGKRLAEIDADDEWMWPIGFLADSHRLAIDIPDADKHRCVSVFDVGQQKQLRRFRTDTMAAIQLASAHSRIAIAQMFYGTTIWVWDINDSTFHRTFNSEQADICGIALSPDAKLLAACTEIPPNAKVGLAMIWDIESGELIQTIKDNAVRSDDDDYWGVTAVAFSPDGKTLVTGNSEGEINFYSVGHEHGR